MSIPTGIIYIRVHSVKSHRNRAQAYDYSQIEASAMAQSV